MQQKMNLFDEMHANTSTAKLTVVVLSIDSCGGAECEQGKDSKVLHFDVSLVIRLSLISRISGTTSQ